MKLIDNMRNGLSFRDGLNFASGVGFYIAIIAVIAHGLGWLFPAVFDDSDAPPLRSGLSIKTDHLTGCQYFSTFTGSITPRLNAAGKQVCAALEQSKEGK